MSEDPKRLRAGGPFTPSGLLRRAAWALEALGLVLAFGVLRALGPERAEALARAVLARVGPLVRKHAHVRRNLAFVLAERPELDPTAVARASWGHFGEVLGDLCHLDRFARDPGRLEVVLEADPALFASGAKPVVLVTAHVGNWELTALAATQLGMPLSVVFSPPASPLAERLVVRARRPLGCALVSKRSGVRGLLRALDAGHTVGIVMDIRLDQGEPVPFFGVPALTSTVAARLALLRGCALVPVRSLRLGPARYRVVFEPPIAPDPTLGDRAAQARAMTRSVNARFEAWIRERPGDWWCVRRRWPREAQPAGSDR